MDLTKLKTQLVSEEGVRCKPYTDTTGNLTIGIGHNLSVPITPAAVDQIFSDDINTIVGQLNNLLPWWTSLDDVRQRALVDMGFNMGIGTLLTFTDFLSLLQRGDYLDAARDLVATKWASQVPTRAALIANMILTGKDNG